MTENQGSMLVAAPERWDEACFAVPAVRALMASGLTVGVFCLPEQREFWETLQGLQVIERPRKARQLAPLLAGRWQAALLWEDGFVADAVVMAKVPQRFGPAAGKLLKKVTHPLTTVEKPLDHRVRFYLSLLEEMGIATGDPEFFSAVDIGVTAVGKTVLLSPESDFGPSHEWLPERWLRIARSLIDGGHRLTIAGIDSRRRGMAESLAGQLGEGVEFFRAAPLAGTLPLLAVHGLVIAADSSIPHLAAHAGATCITLFGPNDPQWRRPLGKRHVVARRHVECAPCLLAKCPIDLRCQRELEVDRVWAVVSAKLDEA